ncbi:unnamed protein product [Orchesella dallaii]|uniref:Odorant receptor n=1 Tax=Orchesella dallaii TaxID=48710 RepID=A0ABP1RT97_9HEXA
MSNNDEEIRFDELYMFLLLSLAISISLATDVAVYAQLEPLHGYMNQVIHYYEDYFGKELKSDINLRSIMKEIVKAFKGKPYDKTGLLIIYLVQYLSMIPILVLFLIYMKVEPFYLGSRYLIPKDYQAIVETDLYRGISGIIFYIVYIDCTRTLRLAMTHVMLIVHLTFTILQDIQGKQKLETAIDEYRKIYSVHQKSESSSMLTAISMGFGYLGAVISGAVTCVGWTFMPGILYIIFPLTWLLINVIMRVSIPHSVEVHEMSKEKIRIWKFRVHFIVRDRHYMKRLVKTLNPLSFRCSDIGSLCMESKKAYLTGILCDTTDLLLMCKSF